MLAPLAVGDMFSAPLPPDEEEQGALKLEHVLGPRSGRGGGERDLSDVALKPDEWPTDIAPQAVPTADRSNTNNGGMTLPTDPHEWSSDDVHAFATEAEPEELDSVLRVLLRAPDERSFAVLRSFLGAAHSNTFIKPVASQLATRALLSLGPPGVAVLAATLLDPDARVRYNASVLAALWQVSKGRGLTEVSSRDAGLLLDLDLPTGTQEAADRAIRDIFAEALVSPDAFWLCSRFLYETAMRELAEAEDGTGTVAAELMGLFAEASIKLSRSVLDAFAELLNRQEREEEYQLFLAAHPVLLDPLAAEVVPKQRLGLELATDFVVRSHDGRWLLVEIERPHDPLFTAAGNLRERFTHAFGQVLEFQRWVDENVAYAQRHMPGISSPRGLVVMGLRTALSEDQQAKLRQFAANSARIDVATSDDLLSR